MASSRRKLPGFTLLELIVALIISSIVITLVYSLLTKLRTTWDKITHQQMSIRDAQRVRIVFDQDIDRSEYILQGKNGAFHFRGESDTIVYLITDKVIRINRGISDTFNIEISGVKADLISEGEKSVVKEISFEVLKPHFGQRVCFRKYYSGQQLLSAFSIIEADGH